jgi:hypothetical protein
MPGQTQSIPTRSPNRQTGHRTQKKPENTNTNPCINKRSQDTAQTTGPIMSENSKNTTNSAQNVPGKQGRPLKFQDPEELQLKIDAYFTHCDNTIINKQHVTGKGDIVIIPTPTPYTMAGLAAWLEISLKNLL